MPVTFYNKTEAMEYARQKQAEGWSIDICGGERGDFKYVVTLGKKGKRPKKGSSFSPYISREEVYTSETINHMLQRLEESNAKKLRTKASIIKKAKAAFKKEGFDKVKVKIERINDRDGTIDAQVSSDGKKVIFQIHPIHQYTTSGNFMATLQHEINHMKEG